ncbi:MAG: indolepyruvate oxidoreductase subunit beta [Anaerolineae bacterium]|nr:indolepyruvate oxidoreductase subunit beta [Anaerolineae bacterium]
MSTTNFVLAGVGGQGTILASDVVAQTGLHLGLDAKKSEVHGMAQRGGAVISHVRWAEKVASPLCEKGAADYLIAQEMLESLRWIDFLRPGGVAVINQQRIPPTSIIFGAATYPSPEEIVAAFQKVAGQVLLVDALGVAERLQNARVANSVLLGALSSVMDVPAEDWLEVLTARVPPRHVAVNRQAFFAGRERQWLAET